ncbi:MAG: hypothetical protein IPN29_20670 [Saprospiraceae bacterium]|nr:hypothetical protein [Saprospiraceae bacterium]
MSDQVLSHKLHLILFDALPKIVEERYVLHKWDALDGTIKIYNQLDSTIIEEKEEYYIGDKIFKSLTNDRDKILFKDKLDCLQPNFRYKFNYLSDKSLCDIIISPEIQIEKEKFRFLKFQISGDETWIVKITYHQNWNDDCYTTQVISKNIMMR